MADPPKKLTFGFSKVVKKSNLVAPLQAVPEKSKDVQFIECLEANTIKLREGEENKRDDAPLVIPIIGPRKSSTLPNGRSIAEVAEDFSDVGNEAPNGTQEVASDSLPANSLDAIAARELLQEGANALKEAPAPTLESLPSADSAEKEALQKESTLEDYENIPVNQFGLAMLRGMGWKPDEGIGKNKKLVPVTAPKVRPKGMGLGADKIILASAASKASTKTKDEEDLRMAKGAYVKILAGMNKNMYGQVEGFTDDSGRVLLKMAIGGRVVSVNEGTVMLVSKKEYSDNGRVLNAAKYEEYKRNEEAGLDPMKIKTETSTCDEKPQQQSASSSRTSKSSNSKSENIKKEKYREDSPKKERGSVSPRQRKGRSYSRSRSKTPPKYNKKVSNNRGQRDRSVSPYKSSSRKTSPTRGDRKKTSSVRNRNQSSSPERNLKYQSPSSRRSRSRSRSVSREKSRYSEFKKTDDDSDSDSKSRKKKKKKQKERKHSSSDDGSRSRSRSPKRRSKSKKHRKSRSRSPGSKRRR